MEYRRSNYDRCYSCGRCRYYDAERDYTARGWPALEVGKCYHDPKPVDTDLYRPVCVYYTEDIEAPDYYPPLCKNDFCKIDAKTGEVVEDHAA